MTPRPRFPALLPLVLLTCIVASAILSAGCTAAPDPVRIGVLLPANGSLATHSLDGLAWAAEALNREGGRPVELVYRDTSTGNISAYAEELAGRGDIDVIIGPATSAELLEIAPLVTGRGKLLMSPSATSGLVTAEFRENDLVWRTCSGDGEQLKAIFGILSDTGVENVSLVAANTTYGATFVRLAPAAAARNGIRLTGTAFVDSPDDITAVAARAAGEEPDLVVAAVYPEEAAGLADALFPTPVFLADAGRSPDLIERLGERSEGISGTSLAPDPSTGYAIAHDEVFGEEPPPFAAQAYDGLLLAVYTAARQEAARGEPLAASLRWVVSGDGATLGWDPREASEAAAMIRAGAHPAVTGASGPLRFGENSAAGPLAGYYTRWTVEGGAFSESTPVASAEVPERLPALFGTGGDRPVVWMVYPLEKGDRSFADSAYRGLFRAEETFDFTKREFTYADLALLDAVFAAQNFTEKPDLVIVEGFQFTDASRRWAAANPDIRFVTLEQEDHGLPNACDAVMVPYGASYLAGVMAANMTETGRIGAVAGAPVGVIEPFVEGFRAGAAAYDPAVNVTVLYVGESFEGFGMPGRAGDLARDLRAGNADVILMIAGSSNTGIVDAVRETGDVFLIGEDADQSYLAPNLVAASVVKNIDAIVYCAVEDEVAGRFTPGQEVWTLENGGTGLFVSPRFSEYGWVGTEWHDRAVAAEGEYLAEIW
ncbi:BMP family ABC transporter substrate-binding protein [Methanoculleus sp. Afa-1]|uniref:BMP family ABC transporter substrate-binding protein n=1 Tax=Methanoculleus formosensis TaxID=2590886 RepID=A0A9E4ZIN8_9EURY|nr:BMP family ABC transporter substrate-binding protein [Methanoculleus sp. Afa-1]MCT8336632.1 BMP family ABC transporter substrate-binding protein [Methanoculleus sp. Afa-1]